MTPEQVVDIQIENYNNRDLEKFITSFSPDVQIFYQGESQTIIHGTAKLREIYKDVFTRVGLRAKVINRITQGDMVIDQEEVASDEHPKKKAIAIYEVKKDLIRRVWFVK